MSDKKQAARNLVWLLKAYAKQPVHALLTGAVISVISFALDSYDYLYEFIPSLMILGVIAAVISSVMALRYASTLNLNSKEQVEGALSASLRIPLVYYSLIFFLLTLVMGGMYLKFGAPDQKIDAISGKIDNLDNKMQAALEKSGVDANPNSREALYRAALKLYEGGEYPEAKKKIEEYISGGTKYIDPYYLYKDILISLYGLDKATEILSNMAETVGNVGFKYIYATTLSKESQTKMLEEIQEEYPDFPMTYFDLARENGWEKVGKPRTFTQKYAEYVNIKKFGEMFDKGDVRRWFISPLRFNEIKSEYDEMFDTVFNSGANLADPEKIVWVDGTFNSSGECELSLAFIENPQACVMEYSVDGGGFVSKSSWLYGCDKEPNDYLATIKFVIPDWQPSEKKDITVRYTSMDGVQRKTVLKDVQCIN